MRVILKVITRTSFPSDINLTAFVAKTIDLPEPADPLTLRKPEAGLL